MKGGEGRGVGLKNETFPYPLFIMYVTYSSTSTTKRLLKYVHRRGLKLDMKQILMIIVK